MSNLDSDVTSIESKDELNKKKSKITKKTNLFIKRLKLKSKHSPISSSFSSITCAEPQPNTSSESSSTAEKEIHEKEILSKSVSDIHFSGTAWKSSDNLLTIGPKSINNLQSCRIQSLTNKSGKVKSVENLQDMPAFGELLFDINVVKFDKSLALQ